MSTGATHRTSDAPDGAIRTIAVMQPYFLPYIGYWQLLAHCDHFVILDDVAFNTRGWIHRNRIMVNGEPHLFTIPVSGSSQNARINDLQRTQADTWRKKFLKTLTQAYCRATHFDATMGILEPILRHEEPNLSQFIRFSMARIGAALSITTTMAAASERHAGSGLTGKHRIIDICQHEKAHRYVNLPGGRDLYNVEEFKAHGLELRFLSPRPTHYLQLAKDFIPSLSIIDVLMNRGVVDTRSMLDECDFD